MKRTFDTKQQSALKILLLAYLVLTASVGMGHAFFIARSVDPWFIADWSINYADGFIRRGLPGEIVKAIHLGTSLPRQWIVLGLSTSFYLFFLYQLARIILRASLDWLKVALILSPATLGFVVFNPIIGFRKEVMFFALLAWAIASGPRTDLARSRLAITLAVATSALVLSHEALLMFMPYLFAALAIKLGSIGAAVRRSWLATLACSIAAVFVLLHPGTLEQTKAVCASLGGTYSVFGQRSSNVCDGAVQWLQVSLTGAHTFVSGYMRNNAYGRIYSVLGLLALGPAVLLGVWLYGREENRKSLQVLAACTLLSMAGTSVLFYGALDWGRWIYIHAVSLMLLLLGLPTPRSGSSRSILLWVRLPVLAVYFFCWALPTAYELGRPGLLGYLDVLRAHL